MNKEQKTKKVIRIRVFGMCMLCGRMEKCQTVCGQSHCEEVERDLRGFFSFVFYFISPCILESSLCRKITLMHKLFIHLHSFFMNLKL